MQTARIVPAINQVRGSIFRRVAQSMKLYVDQLEPVPPRRFSAYAGLLPCTRNSDRSL